MPKLPLLIACLLAPVSFAAAPSDFASQIVAGRSQALVKSAAMGRTLASSPRTAPGMIMRAAVLGFCLHAAPARSQPMPVVPSTLSVPSAASEPTPPLASILTKDMWRIARLRCPVGCPHSVKRFIGNMSGQQVTLGAQTFSAPFADNCDGRISLRLRNAPSSEAAELMNIALPPARRKVTPERLGLPAARIVMGSVYCDWKGPSVPLATLLSVEPTRVLVLFEEHSVIELE